MESRECGKFSLVSLQYKTAKYLSVFRITLQNHFAYIADFLTRTVFLLVILFIFTQLWETTFSVSGKEIIAGYTLQKLLWYLVFTEAIVMAMPRLIDKVETEVKQGDIAYFLNRPLSYIGYHYCGYLAEALIRVTINLWVGGLLIYILYDGIEWTWVTVPTTLLLIISALTLQFLIIMGLSLSSFWIEEVRGYELVYSKMVMILGGNDGSARYFPGMARTNCENASFPKYRIRTCHVCRKYSGKIVLGGTREPVALDLTVWGDYCFHL